MHKSKKSTTSTLKRRHAFMQCSKAKDPHHQLQKGGMFSCTAQKQRIHTNISKKEARFRRTRKSEGSTPSSPKRRHAFVQCTKPNNAHSSLPSQRMHAFVQQNKG
eukprot:1162148-Pelagomonas_calceolata.AAC.6